MDHHVAAAAVRVDGVVFDRRLAGRAAAGHPIVKGLAIKQEEPASLFFCGRQLVIRGPDV